MAACPGTEDLEHFLNRQLAVGAEDAVLAHLDGCATCAQKLEELTANPRRPAPAAVADGPADGFWQRLAGTPAWPHPLSASADTCPPTGPPGRPPLPTYIGPYRILRKVGEGGMGIVYEAEQANPRRRVALKVVRTADVLPSVVKRFADEAQILSRLQHPGIAQVYDAGLADDGQPFFVMEFIRGVPLDGYARDHHLSPPARLNLLAKVCDAVQHAHDKGVVHRDLKPGNVLVDEAGQPKVLDFGVARATDPGVRASAPRTTTGQLIGTLDYMSPEQIAADPAALDWRTDVYSLGVILYELLADRRPLRLTELPIAEVARIILTEDPPRLGTVDPRFRGDVETIAAAAMAKDKGRRYPSAAALAADLRRHLAHEPIPG